MFSMLGTRLIASPLGRWGLAVLGVVTALLLLKGKNQREGARQARAEIIKGAQQRAERGLDAYRDGFGSGSSLDELRKREGDWRW